MKSRPLLRFLTALSCLSGALAIPAHAENLNIFAGSNLGAHERGTLLVELAFPEIAEVGPFIQWSQDSARGTENRYTLGFMGRITLPWLNFFADARAGFNGNATSLRVPEQSGLNLDLGLGYRFVMIPVDLMPRLGFNVVTANDNVPTVNLTLGVAIVL